MSKLFKLKEWVTVDEAARYLSQILNEPVSKADILQMALDRHIKLSVDFPNRAKAKLGRVVPYREVSIQELPSPLGKGTLRVAAGYPLKEIKNASDLNAETLFVVFDEEVVSIDGIWDLALLGNEKIDIQHELQELINGPAVTMINIEGTFLNRSDGTWAALQSKFDDLFFDDEDEGPKKLEGSYYPAGGLGHDCTRVVRTSEILSFQSMLEGPTTDKPLSTRERDTLLSIIAVLCSDAGHDYTKHAKTAVALQSTAARIGISIGETTIENHLKKIPDALGSRMK